MKIWTAACACVLFFSCVTAAELVIEPKNAPVGTPIKIFLRGLQPEEQVTLSASVIDELKRKWTSTAVFIADNDGRVDLSTTAPRSGTYTGIDPMGLFWSMKLAPDEKDQTVYWYIGTEPIIFTVSATRNIDRNFEERVTREIMMPGVRKIAIVEPSIIANLFLPKGQGPFPAIIVLGGEEGGLPPDSIVAQFANQGFAALGLAYYKTRGVPPYFAEIPVEYFQNAVNWLKNRAQERQEINPNNISIAGYSVGGIAALLAASKFKDIKSVIAICGSGVLFQSLESGYQRTGPATFTQNKQPLPFIPIEFPKSSANLLQTDYFLQLYLSSLYRQTAAKVEEATIHVEDIQGPILLIAGLDDRYLGSATLSGLAFNRLRQKGFKHPFELVVYNGVGHTLGPGLPYTPTTSLIDPMGPNDAIYFLGGTPYDTAAARADSWVRINKFLSEQSRRVYKEPAPEKKG